MKLVSGSWTADSTVVVGKSQILFQCMIPGRPGILKNGKRIVRNKKTGKRYTIPSLKYENWEHETLLLLKQAANHQGVLPGMIKGYVGAQFLMYLKNHKHEPDNTNAVQGLEDCLEKAGIIENDKFLNPETLLKIFDPHEPERIEVYIYRNEVVE